jgi:hypothetical protein
MTATTIKHGTRTAYTTDKCRCAFCKAANAAYSRDYYAKHGRVDQSREDC